MPVGLEWGQGCVSKISYTKKVLKYLGFLMLLLVQFLSNFKALYLLCANFRDLQLLNTVSISSKLSLETVRTHEVLQVLYKIDL